MKISNRLGQIYFLGMHPSQQEKVAAALLAATPPPAASPWQIYSRLARPGIIAVREVTRASGLDVFLLEDKELRGVEDVAEIMFYAVEEEGTPGLLKSVEADACLFITFLRLNWDSLQEEQVWRDYGLEPPTRSQIFQSFRTALRKATTRGIVKDQPLSYHVGGGIGDCDALITGTSPKREGLNLFLLTLSQLGTDSIALELGAERERIRHAYPVVAENVTELGIGWNLFRDALHAATVALEQVAPGKLHEEEEKMRERVNQHLHGDLRAAVFLRRSHSALANVRQELTQFLPSCWVKQEVLGEADLLLRFQAGREPHLDDLVCLTARLDQKAATNPSFPRRHSIVLSFDAADGSSIAMPELERSRVLGEDPLAEGRHSLKAMPPDQLQIEEDLSKCAKYLDSIHNLRLREELRIIERMVERCAVLQRQVDLPAETRRVSQLGLRRIARTLERIQPNESSVAAEWTIALRFSLVNSGDHLERTIAHLSRGNVPMLLATPTQARATDHFSSETMLARALAAPASSVAKRLAAELRKLQPRQGPVPKPWSTLLETLQDMEEPIIYTSHGLDFMLARPLGIIHVPRWIMWYPTSSSLILHEVGHAIFSDGRLDDLLKVSAAAIREHAILREWCGALADAAVPKPSANDESAEAPSHWRSDQHEIAAELFNRFFSYPQEAAQAYLFDQLEYLHAIINRIKKIDRISFITRIFTIHIANELLFSGEEPGFLWKQSAAGLSSLVRKAVESFRSLLRAWLQTPPPPFTGMNHPESIQLLKEVKKMVVNLAKQSVEDDRLRDFETPFGRAVQRGVFMALTASSRNAVPQQNNGTLVAHLVWEASIRCSREPEAAEAIQERAVLENALQQLQAGAVPVEACEWPERLPRMLHHAIRRSANPSVLIQQRMALSLYLADWMGRHQSSGKNPENGVFGQNSPHFAHPI